jgi:uncharacterized protein (TIGR03437 family)
VFRLRNQIPRICTALAVFLLGAGVCLAVDVGSGSPSDGIAQKFVNAFFRNGFAYVVTLPPVNNVQRFGSTGLVQEFREAGGTGRLALVKATSTLAAANGSVEVAQVLADVYSYYSSIGVNTAGYPTVDTLTCPQASAQSAACRYQFFDKNYALFVYAAATLNGQNYAVRDPFYTKWTALGGIAGLGAPTDIERNVTASSVTATVQAYANGAIYNVTSGTLSGRIFVVAAPVYAVYQRAGGHDGYLGLPTSDDVSLTGGGHRQSFQGGNLDYSPGSEPVVRMPVDSISILPFNTNPIQLTLGDTLGFRANLYTAAGVALADRTVTWISTNSRVVALESTAGSPNATARAVGAGTAIVSAVSEGKVSPAVRISVTAPCCQIGEGAPTPVITQAIQDAVTRNRLTIALPARSPAQRIGLGYAQELFSTGAQPVRYLVAKPDQSPSAYVVTGDFLARYDQTGGLAGSLGYPASDAAASGRQLFQNASALAGSPVRLVTGAILAKWTGLNFENGAGAPVDEAASVLASTGNRGTRQTFAKGVIFAAANGGAQFVSGLILDRYQAVGGPAGALGQPVSDEYGLDGRRRQDFEAGFIDFAPGDAVAVEHGAARRPAVSAAPSGTVVAGSRLRLSVTGFPDGAALRVSITDQPDFSITAANGAYSWETYVPLTAPSKTYAIRAADTKSGAVADGSYSVKSLAESRLQLVKSQGDTQTGPPGAQLPQKLRVLLQDENGTPVTGVAVTFAASPGGQITPATAVTDESGQAEAVLRLPPAEGLALATAEASRLVATFSARSTASSLSNFPAFVQADPAWGSAALGKGAATIGQKGALLTSAAAIVRYYQNRGDLSGLPVDPGALNQFLQSFCATGADGAPVCDGFLGGAGGGEQVVNLWRIGGMAGGRLDVSIEAPDVAAVRDLLAQGSPALLALSLTANGAPAGGHYVVAIGVAADGSVLIRDPNPGLGRASLNEYLAGGAASQAALAGVIRLLPRTPAPGGFLVAAISQPAGALEPLALDVASAAGPCGTFADLPDTGGPLVSRFRYCDGAQAVYQLSLGAALSSRAILTDLAPGGRRSELGGSGAAVAYKVTRPDGLIAVAPQDVSLSPEGVVNPATLAAGIAPGGLMTILGSGLAGAGGDSAVEVNGVASRVVLQSPFRIDAEVPPELGPGNYALQVRSPYGSAAQSIDVSAAAPAIYRGGVENQNGLVNGPLRPVMRGQLLIVYCTGLGVVVPSGNLYRTEAPVSGILNGVELQVSFAGLTPGFIGLYQVNLAAPLSLAPGIDLPLALRQLERDSNTVFVAVQ